MKKVKDIRSFFKTTQSPTSGEEKEPTGNTSLQPSSSKSDTTAEPKKIIPLGTLETGPSQPRIEFPRTKFGDKYRAFSAQNYEKYNWLEYSTNEDKIYCFVCRIFGTELRGQNEKFAKTGFNNWKKQTDALQKHAESTAHIQSREKHYGYLNQPTNVFNQVISQHEKEVEQNRENLLKIIDIILYLVRQGLALRGHSEKAESNNRGNFLEMVHLFARHDETFSKHLEGHLSYCSPQIQNELIDIMCQITTQEIVNTIKQCGFFSIMVDEARCYKSEKLSIVLRYAVDNNVEESFLGFIDCSTSRDANGLAALIFEFLKNIGLDGIPILAQSYDGASVMSGKHRGLQAIVKEKYPHAIYIHCLAHKLNLAVVDSCSRVSSATKFFNCLEALYVHFSHPGNHSNLQKLQDSLHIKSKREMGSLSTTRWSCRYENCKAVLNNYNTIKTALEEEIKENKDKHVMEAMGLLTSISKPEFLICLHVFESVLLIINILSKYFQNKEATLGTAAAMITGTISTFQESRDNFDSNWNKIKEFADKQDVCLEPTRVSKKSLIDRTIKIQSILLNQHLEKMV